jgi:hypothetical protein
MPRANPSSTKRIRFKKGADLSLLAPFTSIEERAAIGDKAGEDQFAALFGADPTPVHDEVMRIREALALEEARLEAQKRRFEKSSEWHAASVAKTLRSLVVIHRLSASSGTLQRIAGLHERRSLRIAWRRWDRLNATASVLDAILLNTWANVQQRAAAAAAAKKLGPNAFGGADSHLVQGTCARENSATNMGHHVLLSRKPSPCSLSQSSSRTHTLSIDSDPAILVACCSIQRAWQLFSRRLKNLWSCRLALKQALQTLGGSGHIHRVMQRTGLTLLTQATIARACDVAMLGRHCGVKYADLPRENECRFLIDFVCGLIDSRGKLGRERISEWRSIGQEESRLAAHITPPISMEQGASFAPGDRLLASAPPCSQKGVNEKRQGISFQKLDDSATRQREEAYMMWREELSYRSACSAFQAEERHREANERNIMRWQELTQLKFDSEAMKSQHAPSPRQHHSKIPSLPVHAVQVCKRKAVELGSCSYYDISMSVTPSPSAVSALKKCTRFRKSLLKMDRARCGWCSAKASARAAWVIHSHRRLKQFRLKARTRMERKRMSASVAAAAAHAGLLDQVAASAAKDAALASYELMAACIDLFEALPSGDLQSCNNRLYTSSWGKRVDKFCCKAVSEFYSRHKLEIVVAIQHMDWLRGNSCRAIFSRSCFRLPSLWDLYAASQLPLMVRGDVCLSLRCEPSGNIESGGFFEVQVPPDLLKKWIGGNFWSAWVCSSGACLPDKEVIFLRRVLSDHLIPRLKIRAGGNGGGVWDRSASPTPGAIAPEQLAPRFWWLKRLKGRLCLLSASSRIHGLVRVVELCRLGRKYSLKVSADYWRNCVTGSVYDGLPF